GHLLDFFFFDPMEGIEAFHFTGKSAVEAGRVKLRDRRDAAFPGNEVFPNLFRADPAGADQPNSCNDNSAIQ
ncbi:MAG: hypothetical protein WA020_08295, partial [Candidatus Acidiferrales bacterium]